MSLETSMMWYREKNGIDQSLPSNYHHIWKDRVPEVIKLIQSGMSVKDLAEHYGVTKNTMGAALAYRNISVIRVRYEYKLKKG
jgi:hypothetical protein